MFTDPISDYLTRIRNAQMAGLKVVDIPSSKIKQAITKFRNNPKGKIPLIPPDKFLPTGGKREADVFKNAGVDPF